MILADALEIEAAVVNLIRNALEASEGERDAVVSVSVAREGPEAVLAVENPAPRLEAGTVERLNAAPASTKSEGLGLGLSIARSIAESHAGRLVFSSRQGRAVRAELRLPAREA